MRILAWIFNILLFLLALGFALSNTAVTELRFSVLGGDLVARAPLVVFLLAFFVAGVVVGLVVAFPAHFRHRREISRLRREARAREREMATVTTVLPAEPAGASPARSNG